MGCRAVAAGLLASLWLSMVPGLQAAENAPALPLVLAESALLSPRSSAAAMLAVARAGNRLVAAGERGTILLSDDGGKAWRQAQVPVQVTLTALRFADERTGWVAGHMGVILKTVNGGQSWIKQLDGVGAAQLLMQAARSSADKELLRIARRYIDEGPDKPLLDVDVSDTERAIVVGAYNLAFATADGGKSWKALSPLLPNPRALHLYGVRFVHGHVYIVGEQGLLMKSTDGGASFVTLPSPYKGSFFGLLAARSGTLIAYGLRGNAYRSADGGASWQKLDAGTTVTLSGAAELPGGALALLSQTGQVLLSRDDGCSFAALALPPLTAPAAALSPGTGAGLVFASLRGMHSATVP